MAALIRTPSIVVVLALLLASTSLASAQTGGERELAHPGYLQRGTCEQPGEPIAALAETSSGVDRDVESAGDGVEDSIPPVNTALPAAVSVTEIETPLEDLLGDDLIVRVVASADEPEADVACGVVSGQPDDDGNVYVGLAATNDSTIWGVAWLQAEDDVTTLTLFLIPVDADDGDRQDDAAN